MKKNSQDEQPLETLVETAIVEGRYRGDHSCPVCGMTFHTFEDAQICCVLVPEHPMPVYTTLVDEDASRFTSLAEARRYARSKRLTNTKGKPALRNPNQELLTMLHICEPDPSYREIVLDISHQIEMGLFPNSETKGRALRLDLINILVAESISQFGHRFLAEMGERNEEFGNGIDYEGTTELLRRRCLDLILDNSNDASE